jgi:hypothetical protein
MQKIFTSDCLSVVLSAERFKRGVWGASVVATEGVIGVVDVLGALLIGFNFFVTTTAVVVDIFAEDVAIEELMLTT